MSKFHSPFHIEQEFLSPLLCEDIVDDLEFYVPDHDQEGDPIKTIRFDDKTESKVFERIQTIIPTLEERYGIKYHGTEHITVEWFPEGCDGEGSLCENSNYVKKKWLRTKNRDLTGVIFLSDYQEQTPFDQEFEVYGGKFEFPQHQFGFNPERGTLIVYPSDPHFINNTTPIIAGELHRVKFHIAAERPFLYDPEQFPGTYETWLQEFA